jgi:thiol:disulfide interchange protein DsbD
LKFAPVILLAIAGLAFAEDRIAWSVDAQPPSAAPGGTVLIRATARIQPGWHLYSASSPAGRPLSFRVEPGDVLRTFQQPPKRGFDSVLNEESETYEREAVFYAETRLPAGTQPGPTSLNVQATYQICDDKECIPGRWSGSVTVAVDPSAKAAAVPTGFFEAIKPAPGARPAPADQGWTMFLLVAFGFGVASIFTPCVFPMIPITMSYFLNRQSGTRRDSVFQAVVFCLGIVVLFSGLGLAATAILGSSGMAQLGSNPWVNGFIAALFIAFSFSLLGAFEITVPSSLLTRLNKSSEGGGVAGTLLMGLTFSLASFSCVGPFVGTLLAASVTGGAARPAVGMVTFASGLALPFFMLALFPSYLKRLPKSGGWMARVKVVMGFIILAASLKYLSSVDQVMQVLRVGLHVLRLVPVPLHMER